MSIRLRFTLLYNGILALTLLAFGVSLYIIINKSTYDALKIDLEHSSDKLALAVGDSVESGSILVLPVGPEPGEDMNGQPHPQEDFSNDQAFRKLPEREIVRVLGADGHLVASPFGRTEDTLPLSVDGLKALQNGKSVWEAGTFGDQSVLVYSLPVMDEGHLSYILQVARPTTERDRTLTALWVTLLVVSLLTTLLAFGIGWQLSRVILSPMQRLTSTARAIGEERDFSQRVVYKGPQDEVGQLASTFNNMLGHLQDAYQQVAHSLDMQREFVADVSHELRTPLTTLRGNLGLLRRDPPLPAEEQKDILSDMTEESDRMIRLVNDLLVLARADAGRSLAKEPFALRPVLEETVRQARVLEPGREIALDEDDLPEGMTIRGDRDAFKQVLLIAVDNALKHTAAAVRLSGCRHGSQVEIGVRDEGAGIAPERLEKLFDRFYRGEEAVTLPGFGLGLPIARSLILAQGGEIWMESLPGQGSTLLIRMAVVGVGKDFSGIG